MKTAVAAELEDQVRAVVVAYLAEHPDSVEMVAESLGVKEASVKKLLEREHWDLGLCLSIADKLGVHFRVAAA